MLLGAIQGFIFSGIAFFSKKYRNRSIFFLALLILCFAVNNIQYYLWETGIVEEDIFFGYLYFPLASLSIVVYYFYVKLFLYPKTPISLKEWLLFLPFGVFFLLTLYYKIGYLLDIHSEVVLAFYGWLIFVHEIFGVLYSLIILGYTYWLILKFEKKQLSGHTQIPRVGLNWLKIISIISFILCLIWVISIFDELKNGSENVTFYYFLWVGSSFTIYILGHIGMYRFGILEEQKSIQKFSNYNKSNITVENAASQNGHIEAFEKYIKTEKNYLNADLSMDMVAEKLNINKSHLSRLVNNELQKSFSDYVNELRVEEAKSYLENQEFRNYTLVAIGLEAGFNSKSTFNSTFKKFTGLTPSEFKKSLETNT